MRKTTKAAGTRRVPPAARKTTAPLPKLLLSGGRHTACACYVFCLLLIAGCGLEGPVPSGPKHEATTPAPANAPSAPNSAATDKAVTRGGPARPGAEARPGTVREKAAVGMGEKGRGYGGDMITVPLMALWRVQERVVLEKMHHDLELYKAEHDGQPPKTEKEFMDKIIKENNVHLPTLPARHRYVYDPAAGELMIEKPNDL